MIPASSTLVQPPTAIPDWQQELSRSLRTPEALAGALHLPLEQVVTMIGAHNDFPIRVTDSYLQRIEPGNPQDPLLLQILPQTAELQEQPGFSHDPVGDQPAIQGRGVLQKYHGRALLVTTAACGIHCRYCFRRHYDYSHQGLNAAVEANDLSWIQQNPTIREIILSGGDPLMLSNRRLLHLLTLLESIPHLQTVRIHTRMPIATPNRLDQPLLDALLQSRLKVVMVIHANHPRELDESVAAALAPLVNSPVMLLNQSVLLRKINDQPISLEALSLRLFECGVLPYYLFLLDRVQGSHHFEVSERRAIELIDAIGTSLPGYLIPRLVREIEGEPRKSPVHF